jgi:serine/threonine-protein kinase
MALTPGQRLGAYEVVSALGAGGMGEVYRARDTKLQRDVAIKVLPESLATDRDRLARFEREAQLLAALNHPHIAAIYGVDTAADTQFLVLELVEGDTLADRIARGGALPLSEAVAMARQIADALQAAHDKGIIHRDLKPANIALTADGHVKVLDFGLAKAMEGAPAAQSSAPAATLSPTLSMAMTEAGFILGTAAYMSPEQAKGRPADKRSDVWAFGCVLFEMLTGKRAFEGEDASDTLAGILRGEPDWKALPRSTPPHVREVLTGCLAKDRKQRFTDIAVVAYLLGDPARFRQVSERRLSRRGAVVAALLIIAVAAGAGLRTWGRDAAAPAIKRFSIVPPPQQSISGLTADRQLVFSPDGLHIAYVSTQGQLALRHMERLEAEFIPGITNARVPFWSPDSKWVGFTANNIELRKVSLTGGPSALIARIVAPPRGATWSSDGTIVFATADTASGLFAVPSGGGEPKPLTRPDTTRGEVDHLFPSAVPGRRAVLFSVLTRANNADSAQIAVLDLDTGDYKVLLPGGANPEYVEPGYLIYAASGALRAVRFDASRLEVVGDPVPVVDQISMSAAGAPQYSVSRGGDLVYIPGSASAAGAGRTLVWVDRAGREVAVAGAMPRGYQYPRLSRDNTRVALTLSDREQDIHVFHFARQTLTQVTFGPAVDLQGVWFPDDQRILFSSTRSGPANLYVQRADGSGQVERLTDGPANQLTTTISPDGKYVVLLEQHERTGNDLALLRLDRSDTALRTPGGGAPPERKLETEPFIATNYTEAHPELSPDGRFLAYMSNDTGQQQIYVVPFPDRNGRWLISQETGTRPVWSANGKELFYATSAGAIMAVPILQTSPTFVAGNPVKLFDWPTIGVPGLARTYDVSRDGRRFLMIKEPGGVSRDAPPSTMAVVLNWVEEVKARLPRD